MKVELTFDRREWDELLRSWQEPAVKRTLQAAASAFGRAAKPIVKAEIPEARPGNPYAKGPGNLRATVRYRRFRAGRGIGVVIAPMGKSAYYRRWVAGGTKAHVILPKAAGSRGQARRALAIAGGFARVVHHPGAKPNDFIARAEGRAEGAGFDKAEAVLFDGLDAKRVLETIDT